MERHRVDKFSPLSDELLLNVVSHCDPTSSIALKYASRRFFTLIDPHPQANRNVLTLMILHDNIMREREILTPAKCLRQRLKDLDMRIVQALALHWTNGLLWKPFTWKDTPRHGVYHYLWDEGDAPDFWPDPRKDDGGDTSFATYGNDKGRGFCLHLLRLRPAWYEVGEWRHGLPSDEMDIIQNQGCTGYLWALAPPTRTLETFKLGPVLMSTQRVLLEQIYDIAALEEALLNGAVSSALVSEVLLELNRQLVMSTMDAERLNTLFHLGEFQAGS